MQTRNSLSLTTHVTDWLANTQHPRILHVFEHACNLINEHKEVLSIVTPQIRNGPFNLVIPRLRKSFERLSGENVSRQTSEVFANISLQSPVSIFQTQLHLGDLTITTTHAKSWNPRPDWEQLHAQREFIFDRVTKLPMILYRT